jgi:mRNA interferase HigB
MVIISRRRLREFWEVHADAGEPLNAWYRTCEKADWSSLSDVHKTYPKADGVRLECDRIVTVFNIGGNKYRLVTDISYRTRTIYVKCVLTHPEYSRENWKVQLCR